MIIEMEGVHIEVDPNASIEPKDVYIAKRNTGWKILTCKENKGSYIVPEEPEYCYNVWECRSISYKFRGIK